MIVLKNILVPTDFGAASEAALHYGRTLAEAFSADLHLLQVIEAVFLQATFADPSTFEASAQQQLRDRARDDDHCRFRTHRIIEKFDSPLDAIITYARSAAIDLIVMGTLGRRGRRPRSNGQCGRARRSNRALPGAGGEASGARIHHRQRRVGLRDGVIWWPLPARGVYVTDT